MKWKRVVHDKLLQEQKTEPGTKLKKACETYLSLKKIPHMCKSSDNFEGWEGDSGLAPRNK